MTMKPLDKAVDCSRCGRPTRRPGGVCSRHDHGDRMLRRTLGNVRSDS